MVLAACYKFVFFNFITHKSELPTYQIYYLPLRIRFTIQTLLTLLTCQSSYSRIRKFPVISAELFLFLRYLFIFWRRGHHFGLVQTGIVSLWKLNLFGPVLIGEFGMFLINICINTHLTHKVLYCYGCERDVWVCSFNLF